MIESAFNLDDSQHEQRIEGVFAARIRDALRQGVARRGAHTSLLQLDGRSNFRQLMLLYGVRLIALADKRPRTEYEIKSERQNSRS